MGRKFAWRRALGQLFVASPAGSGWRFLPLLRHNRRRWGEPTAMPIYILVLLLEIACIVHIMRTGRERFWIYIVLFLPMAGMLAYLAAEVLPDLLGSRTAH